MVDSWACTQGRGLAGACTPAVGRIYPAVVALKRGAEVCPAGFSVPTDEDFQKLEKNSDCSVTEAILLGKRCQGK